MVTEQLDRLMRPLIEIYDPGIEVVLRAEEERLPYKEGARHMRKGCHTRRVVAI